MTHLGAIIGTVSTLFTYFVLIAALQRLFTISRDLGEIRDLLKEFKREKEAESVVRGPAPTPWPESATIAHD